MSTSVAAGTQKVIEEGIEYGIGKEKATNFNFLRFLQMIDKLKKSVESGNFYEAQQMYKSVYARFVLFFECLVLILLKTDKIHRYMSQKKSGEAIELLQSGAIEQLKQNQVLAQN